MSFIQRMVVIKGISIFGPWGSSKLLFGVAAFNVKRSQYHT